MKRPLLARRSFLKAAGGFALAVPTLEAMFDNRALAAGGADPKRYICLYQASGTYLKANDGAFWYPGSTNGPLDAANLPAVFSPFAANVNDLTIVRGLKNKARNQCGGKGGDHSTAVASYLTSAPYTNGDDPACTIQGDSFEQAMAKANNLKAWALSAGGYDGYIADLTAFDYARTVSYLGGQQANVFLNPVKLFTTLFSGLPMGGTPPPKPPVFARNKSILDSAVAGIAKLKSKVGTADRQRVDAYYSGLRAFESTYLTGDAGVTMSSCVVGAPPASSLDNEDHNGTGTDFVPRLKAFMDCMVLAMQCDVGQMFSLMFEYENTNRQFKNQIPSNLIYQGANMDTPGSHNEIAHWSDGGTGEEAERSHRCVSRDRFYASQVMYLVNALKGATDPSGAPMLDNTIIQWGVGLEDGNHNTDGMQTTTGHPTVLAGGKNMLSLGKFVSLPNNDLSDLYFTLNSKLGMGLTSFGGSTTKLTL